MPKKKAAVEDKLCSTIKGMVDEARGLTSTWESKNEKWYKMRQRVKKEKNFPFEGCANIRMPTIEIKLRKLKASLVNVIFGIRPVVQVVPSPSGNWETARKIEKFLDHMICDIMHLKTKAVIAIDQMLEKGFYIMKPFWKIDIIKRIEKFDIDDLSMEEAQWLYDTQRTTEEIKMAVVKKYDIDQSDLVKKFNTESLKKVVEAILKGDKSFETEFEDVICNYPDVSLAEPERIIVPTDGGYDPQELSWIVHEFLLPIETLRQNARNKNWNISLIENVATMTNDKTEGKTKSASKNTTLDVDKDLREGIQQLNKTGKVKIWEFYGYYDINKDGNDEKCVFTLAPDFDATIRKITIPFYSGKYPFVKLFYELTDDRWFAHRGIPELIEDIVKEIDMQHNMKLDQQTMRNSPMYVYRAGMINKDTVQFIFGQGLPAQGLQPLNDLIMPLNNSNQSVEFSYEREQMILEGRVEELIGQPDYTLQSMINKRQPRTLGEVNLQAQAQQNVFSLDASMCVNSFEELFTWIWDLWCQYGDDSYEFAYFGKEGWEPIRLTKEEVQGHYKVTVRGNDQNTNSQVRLQKAQMIIQMQSNPSAQQSGVVTPQNLANGYKRAMQEMDIPNWEELVSMPQPPQPTPPPPPPVKLDLDNMTDGEAAQVLQKYGIQPDVRGRGLKSAAKIQEKEVQQDSQEIDDITKMAETMMTVGGEADGTQIQE